jgi:futalosine hydrolase
MEGFGVALACALARVPLAIVRGISNAAGERDTKRWRIREALAAARETALELLRRPDWGTTG